LGKRREEKKDTIQVVTKERRKSRRVTGESTGRRKNPKKS